MKKQLITFCGMTLAVLGVIFTTACATAPGAHNGDALGENLVVNPGFETDNMDVWRVSLDGVPNPPNVYDGDGTGRGVGPDIANHRSGQWGFRWWRPANNPISFTIEQDIIVPESGVYRFGLFLTGGNAGPRAVIYTYILVNGTEAGRSGTLGSLPGWTNWNNPAIEVEANEGDVVTIGASLNFPNNTGGAWGTLDDFTLFLISR